MTALSLTRGDTADFSFTLTDADTGLPLDLTGSECVWALAGDPAAAVSFTLAVAAPLTGIATAALTPAQTNALTEDVYRWSVYVQPTGSTEPPADRRTALSGTLTVAAAVRKAVA